MHSIEPQIKKHVYEFLSSIFLVSDIIFAALLVMARRTRTYYYHSYGQLYLAQLVNTRGRERNVRVQLTKGVELVVSI